MRRHLSWSLALLLASCAAPHGDRRPYVPPPLAEEDAPRAERSPGPNAPSFRGLHADETKPLTLDEALEIALDRSRGLRIADRRILIAEDRVDEAYTGYLPHLDARASYSSRNNDVGGSFGGMSFSLGDRTAGTVNVSLVVPIYTFGRVENLIDEESLRRDVAEESARRARQDLALAVSQAFFRLLEAQKILTVVDDSIAVVQRQLEISEDFLSQGLVARNDVLSVKVQLAHRAQQRLQAANNVQLARATLNRLLELDVQRNTQVVDVLEGDLWKGRFETLLSIALEERPDLRARAREIEIARAEFRKVRSDHAPRLFAFGDYNYTTDSFVLNDDWVSGGVALEVPIFDGLQTYTRLRRKDKEILEAVDLRDELVDGIVLEVKRVHLLLQEAVQQIPVARQAIDEAEENLRITRDQYAEGWVTSADVLREEERRSRARSAYYQALYSYHEAFARLTHVIGAPPPPSEPQARRAEPQSEKPKADE